MRLHVFACVCVTATILGKKTRLHSDIVNIFIASKSMIVHLGCGLGNRLFAIMNTLQYNPFYVWETIGMDEPVSFADLFYAPHIKFVTHSDASTIQIDKLVTSKEFNMTGKTVGSSNTTFGCCLCGPARCVQKVAQSIKPHPSLWADLERMKRRIDATRDTLHIRHDTTRKLYQTKTSVLQRLSRHNYSFVAAEQREHLRFFHRSAVQDDVRTTYRGRRTRRELLSAVFDMYALSFGKHVHTTKRFSTFSRFSQCLQ